MKITLLRALAVAGMVLAITSPSHGFEGFLRVDGVKGESTDQRYRDWIVVTAVGWGHQLPIATGSMGSGASVSRTQFQPFTVSKILDSTSPGLAEMAADGRAIRQVFLDLVQGPGQAPFARIELQDVVLSSYSVEGVAGTPQRPVEKLSFRFGKITWGAFPTQPGGPGAEISTAGMSGRIRRTSRAPSAGSCPPTAPPLRRPPRRARPWLPGATARRSEVPPAARSS